VQVRPLGRPMELPEEAQEAQEVRLSQEVRPPQEVLEVELPQKVGELWVAQLDARKINPQPHGWVQ
jgi:hypothetical protein